MQSKKAQAKPEAPHSIHNAAAVVAGEEVPRETIPKHRRTCRILFVVTAYRDTSENLVSKSPGESETAAGSRTRKNQNGSAW